MMRIFGHKRRQLLRDEEYHNVRLLSGVLYALAYSRNTLWARFIRLSVASLSRDHAAISGLTNYRFCLVISKNG